MTAIEDRLQAALAADRFILIGAGQLGEMALDLWPAALKRPELFLDTHRRGDLRGIPIEHPAIHRRLGGVTYLVSAFKIDAVEVKAILARLGIEHLVTVYDFFQATIPETFSNGWRRLDPPSGTWEAIRQARAVFSEPVSLRTFDAAVDWRYARTLNDDFPLYPEKDKYNLAGFGRARAHYDHVYDCGCYDLSLHGSLVEAGVTFDHYVAFEPDPSRHRLCRARAAAIGSAGRSVMRVEDLAVCEIEGQARFLANGGFSSRLIDAAVPVASIPITTTSLDAFHARTFPSRECRKRILIKAHVESAEPHLIRGAEALIGKHATDVLVSLSHDEESFLSVPGLLRDYGDFDFFLRAGSLFGEGLTLLARTRELAPP